MKEQAGMGCHRRAGILLQLALFLYLFAWRNCAGTTRQPVEIATCGNRLREFLGLIRGGFAASASGTATAAGRSHRFEALSAAKKEDADSEEHENGDD